MKKIMVTPTPTTVGTKIGGNNIPMTVIKVLTPTLEKAGESLGDKISKGIDRFVDSIFSNK
jgi:hypothetical protein